MADSERERLHQRYGEVLYEIEVLEGAATDTLNIREELAALKKEAAELVKKIEAASD